MTLWISLARVYEYVQLQLILLVLRVALLLASWLHPVWKRPSLLGEVKAARLSRHLAPGRDPTAVHLPLCSTQAAAQSPLNGWRAILP